MGLVYMKHKDAAEDGPPAVTTDEAFDQVWADKGWVLCDASGVVTEDLGSLAVAALRDLAAERGLDSSGTKADLVARLSEVATP